MFLHSDEFVFFQIKVCSSVESRRCSVTEEQGNRHSHIGAHTHSLTLSLTVLTTLLSVSEQEYYSETNNKQIFPQNFVIHHS